MREVFVRFSETLARTERMPLPDLARYQEQLLLRLVRHATEHLPFYRERLACLLGPQGSVDLGRWNEVPLLVREDVIAPGAEMRVAQLPADLGPITQARTSGPPGVPPRA